MTVSKKDLPELTPKQDGALKHYILHGNKSEAYREYYDCQNAKDETIHRSAKDLFDNPKLRAWLDYHRDRADDQFEFTLTQRKKMLAKGAALGLKLKVDAQGNNIPHSIAATKECIAEYNRIEGDHAPSKTLSAHVIETGPEGSLKDKDPIEASRVYQAIMNGEASLPAEE